MCFVQIILVPIKISVLSYCQLPTLQSWPPPTIRLLCCLSQAFAGSDIGELSFGSPINVSAVLIILLHQVIESHTLVRCTATLKAVRNHLFSNWILSPLPRLEWFIIWHGCVMCKNVLSPYKNWLWDCVSLIFCVVLQTWIHVLVLVLSGGFYFGFVLLFSLFCVTCSPPTNPLGVETLQMSQPLFYIICALTTVMALLPRYTHLSSNNLQ